MSSVVFSKESFRRKQLLHWRTQHRYVNSRVRERKVYIQDKNADADIFSRVREAKTNNAKANILANFGGGDLSLRSAGILMGCPGVTLLYPFSVIRFLSWTRSECFMNSRKIAKTSRQPRGGNNRQNAPSCYILSVLLSLSLFFLLLSSSDSNRGYEPVKGGNGGLKHASRESR